MAVGELPCAEDFLFGQKAALYGLGMMASAAIGPSTGVAGLAIAPAVPASLSFTIGAGSIYSSQTVDATAYGVLGTDTHTIIKQGILAAPVTLTVTPPSTSGFSQVFLVQVGYADVDNGAALVPFFNSADPTHPSSSTQNTIRQGALVVQMKAGTAASTGSQTTPTPDPGFTGIWAITVANGATTVTSANWSQQSVTPYSTPWFPNLESLTTIFQPIIPQTTFFVDRSIGSDTLYDGTSATIIGSKGPWATIQNAINILSTFNFGGQTVTVQLGATGTYSGSLAISNITGGTLAIKGNTSSQSSYTISGPSPAFSGLVQVGGGSVSLVGLTLSNQTASATSTNLTVGAATCSLQNVTFAGVAGSQSLLISNGGHINILAGCIFSQSSGACWTIVGGGTIGLLANTTTSGSPAWGTACIVASSNGSFGLGGAGGWTFTNTGATGPRYLATLNGIINTNGGGANFFPGNAVGTTSTGGQYA